MSRPKGFNTSQKKSWFDEGINDFPSPTAYSIPKPSSNVKTIGLSSRTEAFLDSFRFQNPSPQHYTITNSRQKECKGITIPNSTRPELKVSGVGTKYNPVQITPKAPQYTFSYACENNYQSQVPPPGSYNINNSIQSSFNHKQYHFTLATRNNPLKQEPGVGAYTIQQPTYKTNQTFYRAKRNIKYGSIPPATFYQHKQKQSKGVTIGKKYQDLNPEEPTPGPFDYNPKKSHRLRNVFIQKSNRSTIQNTAIINNPSPQHYSTARQSHSQAVPFRKQVRRMGDVVVGPAPNHYNLEDEKPILGGVICLKPKTLKKDVYPSPHQYRADYFAVHKKPKTAINLRSNRSDFAKTITGKIGPGEYEIRKDERVAMGKIGKSARISKERKNNPGPGSYETISYVGKLPNYYK